MTTHTRAVAEAFSGHRFAEAYDHLAPSVRWVVRGEEITEGKDDVIAACEQTLTELTNVTTEFTRFVVAADDDTAAVDATGHYTGRDGSTSVVSSCDISNSTKAWSCGSPPTPSKKRPADSTARPTLLAVPCAGDPMSGTTDLVRLESSNAQLALR
jgi:hypothetical protein